MERDHRFEMRLSGKEHRALMRFARAQGKTVADLIRLRVVNAALVFDPKQGELLLQERGGRERAG